MVMNYFSICLEVQLKTVGCFSKTRVTWNILKRTEAFNVCDETNMDEVLAVFGVVWKKGTVYMYTIPSGKETSLLKITIFSG